ncbi:hypothetical protein [Mycolicibacterium smegmatis]|uniref:hypothetical protein n=1 Tax=Mycolicibacterium smegmatis TaxID=1772 RepID=UPI00130308EA|nr:hypothetical protein [Mycolicibacterium smegmatis]
MSQAQFGCTCSSKPKDHPDLAELLAYADGKGTRTARWRTARLAQGNADALDLAACVVANAAISWRTVGAPSMRESWTLAVNEGRKLSSADAEIFKVYIDHAFGLPEAPREGKHRRGWLAEFIFYLIAEEAGSVYGRTLVHAEGPDWHATKPGRDSLVFWRSNEGLEFRLWEVKHNVGSAPISTSVGEATTQLRDSALSYLAQATSIAAAPGAATGDEDLKRLYGELPRLWATGSPKSGIGITVATLDSKIPTRCFSRVAQSFPRLQSPAQIEGLISGIGNFSDFADDVRDRVWTTL